MPKTDLPVPSSLGRPTPPLRRSRPTRCLIVVASLVAACVGPTSTTRHKRGPARPPEPAPVAQPAPPLDNGLSVWVVPRPNASAVAVQLWVPAGSAAGRTGVEALVIERAIADPTGPSPLGHRVRGMGGRLESWVQRDSTVFQLLVAEGFLEPSLRVLAAAIQTPDLSVRAIESHTASLKPQTLAAGRLLPNRHMAQLFGALFGAHPLARPPVGASSGIQKVSVQSVREVHEGTYRPRGSLLILAGPILEAPTRELVRSVFEGWAEPIATPPAQPAFQHAAGSKVAVARPGGESTWLWVALPIAEPTLADAAAFDVAAQLLAGSDQARAARALGRTGVTAQSTFAHFYALRGASVFIAAVALEARGALHDPAVVEAAWSVLVEEVMGLAGTPPGAPAFDEARRRVAQAVDRASADLLGTVDLTAQLAFRWPATAGDMAYRRALSELDGPGMTTRIRRGIRRDRLCGLVSIGGPSSGIDAADDAQWEQELLALVNPNEGRGADGAEVAANGTIAHLEHHTTVAVHPEPGTGRIAVRAILGRGLLQEPQHLAGAAYVAGHVIAAELSDSRHASDVTFEVGRDGLAVDLRCRVGALDQCIRRLGQLLTGPAISPDVFESARHAARVELAGSPNAPTTLVRRLFAGALYGGHPYGRAPSGTVDDLARLGLVDVGTYLDSQIVHGPLVVAIVGDAPPEHAMRLAKLELAKPRMPPVRLGHPPAPPPRIEKAQRVRRHTGSAWGQVVGGFAGLPSSNPDRIVVAVLAEMMARRVRGVLPRAHVEALHFSGMAGGHVAVHIVVPTGRVDEAREVLRGVADTLRRKSPEINEVREVREVVAARRALSLVRARGRVARLAREAQVGRLREGPDPLSSWVSEVRAVGPREILRVAGVLLRPEGYVEAVVSGSPAKAAPVAELQRTRH